MINNYVTYKKDLVISSTGKLDSLGLLRGVAVLLVCIDHYGYLLSSQDSPELRDLFHTFGRYGVHIFFVVSGFVIPLSLYKGGYRIHDYGRFLYKRFLRLQPPYVASVALTFLIIYALVVIRHDHTSESLFDFIATLFYLHIPASNTVYWTLIVEVQFYFTIGLLYPLIIKLPKLVCPILFLSVPILNYLFFGLAYTYSRSLLAQSPFFFVGMIGFLIYTKTNKLNINIVLLGFLFGFIYFLFPKADFFSSLFAFFFILFYAYPVNKLLQFPGKISYSVYLIHVPIGVKIILFMKPRISDTLYPIFCTVLITGIFYLGHLFYKIFEVKSEAYSSQIKYTGKKQKENSSTIFLSEKAIENESIQ